MKPAKDDKCLLKMVGNGRKWLKLAELVKRENFLK
jgi:hypothetical protein